ncbi:3-deoxy-D-manno-octulosonate 8-phosphate phosphatase [Candidatus Francisella endociliophora]|uniref:3-deoxy-D-manno-octulosonate 8-phosphate phosphatase KdsC n=1 Tax=Candidatus Francisella endociliophora TaxID=653937 RepID=A0A097EM64_9GAMM|nr:HAD-IIIA family hydrolase [Francisella sp. FSC1006]AIT08662.1 3-deoxy-D-manno-octulosonate 8-phosphate phosphatase [Francisella sp. FSC1006]
MKTNNLKDIKLLIFDIDGVLTDSKIIISNDGNEFKNFNVKDGLGLVLVQKLGIKIAIITGKESKIVQDRLTKLGVDPEDIFQGQKNKLKAYESLKVKYSLQDQNIAYMGDDLPDLILMNKVGLSATPVDSISIVKKYSNYICKSRGGDGAAREFCDYIIEQLGLYDKVIDDFVNYGGVK